MRPYTGTCQTSSFIPGSSAINAQGFSQAVAAQPDQSIRQSGPFLQNGVSVIR